MCAYMCAHLHQNTSRTCFFERSSAGSRSGLLHLPMSASHTLFGLMIMMSPLLGIVFLSQVSPSGDAHERLYGGLFDAKSSMLLERGLVGGAPNTSVDHYFRLWYVRYVHRVFFVLLCDFSLEYDVGEEELRTPLTYTCAYTYTFTHTFTLHIHIHIHTGIRIHTHIHIHIHKHIHTHAHAHTQTFTVWMSFTTMITECTCWPPYSWGVWMCFQVVLQPKMAADVWHHVVHEHA
jgi:hypothetical protein